MKAFVFVLLSSEDGSLGYDNGIVETNFDMSELSMEKVGKIESDMLSHNCYKRRDGKRYDTARIANIIVLPE